MESPKILIQEIAEIIIVINSRTKIIKNSHALKSKTDVFIISIKFVDFLKIKKNLKI